MKKVYLVLFSGLVLGVLSCSNEKTDKAQDTTTPETVSPAPAPVSKTTAPVRRTDRVEVEVKETPKTEISIGQSGGSVKTKKGTSVKVDDKGVNVGTKDVLIDIKK